MEHRSKSIEFERGADGRLVGVNFPQTGGFLKKVDGTGADRPTGSLHRVYDARGKLSGVTFVDNKGRPTGYLKRDSGLNATSSDAA